jgi:hypothetical protein
LLEDFWVPQLFCRITQSAKQSKPPNHDLGCRTSNNCGIKIHSVSYLKALLLLKVDVPCPLCFFTYSSIKKHYTSIVGSEGNRIYNRQSLQLKSIGFRVWRGRRPPILPKCHCHSFVPCTVLTWHVHF